jgi:hypothetical protein
VYRQWRFGYPFRKIPLGQGLFSLVDPQDYYQFNMFNWFFGGNGKGFYAFRNVITGPGKTKMVSMHREIMDFPKGLLVDHRNGVTLDNRRANLRPATHAQNACNKRNDKSKTTSRFNGVTFDKDRGLWAPRIRAKGKRLFLGRFKNEIDAARAYDQAAIKYHGEFARLNSPNEKAGACPPKL